jgi:hypothetical protein
MKKIIVVASLLILMTACGSKPKQSQDFVYGSQLYKRFTNYYLKGEPVLAEKSFAAAEKQFLSVDGLCNLSRIYIGRYVLDEGKGEPVLLEKAAEYSKLGKCESEKSAILYLMESDYDKKVLPEPFKSLAKAGLEDIEDLAESSDFQDVTRSRLYRKAAIGYLLTTPEKSYQLAEAAMKIDKFHGWSVNILRDMIIMKSSLIKQGKDTKDINKRIELIKSVLNKK